MASATGNKARYLVSACAALVLALALVVPAAMADELQDVQNELAAKATELNTLTQEISDTQAQAQQIDARIDSLLADIDARQKTRADLQGRISNLAAVIYKDGDRVDFMTILTSSESLTEVLSRLDMRERVLEEYAGLSLEQQQEQEELEATYREVSEQKDQQVTVMAELMSQKEQLDAAVANLATREAQLNAEQQAALAEAAAASHTVVDTFETVFDPVAQAIEQAPAQPAEESKPASSSSTASPASTASESSASQEQPAPAAEPASTGPTEAEQVAIEASGWRTGLASAYGGSSDSSTPNPGTTATGALCDDWSVGVAVPMAWGPAAYYGKKVEISYGGRSVVATVNDCGGMNGGERHLDLQPGVFKALGFSTCSDWGVREVQYRFL